MHILSFCFNVLAVGLCYVSSSGFRVLLQTSLMIFHYGKFSTNMSLTIISPSFYLWFIYVILISCILDLLALCSMSQFLFHLYTNSLSLWAVFWAFYFFSFIFFFSNWSIISSQCCVSSCWQQSESAMHILTSSPSGTFPPLPIPDLKVVTEHWAELPVPYSSFLLAKHSTLTYPRQVKYGYKKNTSG